MRSGEITRAEKALREAVAQSDFEVLPAAVERYAAEVAKGSGALEEAREIMQWAGRAMRAARAHLQEDLRRTEAASQYLTSEDPARPQRSVRA